jgi:hypothetical protein
LTEIKNMGLLSHMHDVIENRFRQVQ